MEPLIRRPKAALKTYWAKQMEVDPDIDPHNDLFCDLLEENAKAHPKYQSSYGDWLNWTVPDTDCSLPIFASGWGDGYYPVYFGYDAKGYPATDDLLSPFAGHKNMANFGVEDGALTDACFPVFSAMPKLRYLLLDGKA